MRKETMGNPNVLLDILFNPSSKHKQAKKYIRILNFIRPIWKTVNQRVLFSSRPDIQELCEDMKQRMVALILMFNKTFIHQMKERCDFEQRKVFIQLSFMTKWENFERLFWLIMNIPKTFPQDLFIRLPQTKNGADLFYALFIRLHMPTTYNAPTLARWTCVHEKKIVMESVPLENVFFHACPVMDLHDFLNISSLNPFFPRSELMKLSKGNFNFRILVFITPVRRQNCDDDLDFTMERCVDMYTYEIRMKLFAQSYSNNIRTFKQTVSCFNSIVSFLGIQTKQDQVVKGYDKDQLKTPKVLMERHIQKHFVCDPEDTIRGPYRICKAQLTEGQKQTLSFCRHQEKTNFMEDICCVVEQTEKRFVVVSPYFRCPIFLVEPHRFKSACRVSGGCIANTTGTGKTLSALLLCQQDTMNLVVVPSVLHEHWLSEIQKYTTATICHPELSHAYPETPYVLSIHSSVEMQSAHFPTHTPPWIVLVSSHAFRSAMFLKYFWGTSELRTFTRLIVEEAHLVSPKIQKRIAIVPRNHTWLITATPYQNTLQLLDMLQFNKVEETLTDMCTPNYLIWCPYLFSVVTLRTTINMQNIEISTEVVKCPMSNDEVEFFETIRGIVKGSHKILRRDMTKLNRFFRILERVSSGGKINAKLMISILSNTFSPKRKRWVLEELPVASSVAIADGPKTACSICFTPFDDPCQIGCRHVFCWICVQSMLEMNLDRCALCRAPMKSFFQPLWSKEQPKDTSSQDCTSMSLTSFENLLNGTFNDSNCLLLRGKLDAFREHLHTWVKTRAPQDQLLLFLKDNVPSREFSMVLEELKLSYICGGLQNVNRQTSVHNIEAFRRDTTIDVLFLSTRYCTGFDLSCASQVWLLNTDLYACKMEQSQGRVIRLSQKHKKINIKVFVYDQTFGHFLWEMKHLGQVRYTKSNLLLFEYFLFRYDPTSVFGQVRQLVSKIFSMKVHVSSTSDGLIFNHGFRYMISSGLVVCGCFRYNLSTAMGLCGERLFKFRKHCRTTCSKMIKKHD